MKMPTWDWLGIRKRALERKTWTRVGLTRRCRTERAQFAIEAKEIEPALGSETAGDQPSRRSGKPKRLTGNLRFPSSPIHVRERVASDRDRRGKSGEAARSRESVSRVERVRARDSGASTRDREPVCGRGSGPRVVAELWPARAARRNTRLHEFGNGKLR